MLHVNMNFLEKSLLPQKKKQSSYLIYTTSNLTKEQIQPQESLKLIKERSP